MSQNKSKTLVIVLGILVLASGFGYGAAFTFLREQALAVSQQTQVLEEKNRQESRLDSVQALVADTVTERQLMYDYFITEETVATFIEFIEELNDDTGVGNITVTSVAADVPQAPNETGTLSVNVTIDGSWRGVLRTVEKLETAPYAITLRSVRFAGPSAPTEEGAPVSGWTVTADMEVPVVAQKQ